ncbi:uncharacterized protein LOC126788012 [Argentina anserina]|uniref:uncharacterized protein LOC126788012 n=1 Tax=Argentina anserina TaxID=57926 RepID=UPI0021763C4B|nr:uncharacterized protein LOC126788012 [Potentilla anserina]XP_050369916.1 uncharacterized protein LOC126788012 [Potentilla anserina]XP_050369918.1 uncharacterized protein LOC126788012 [Potentilla anserina]XP_050369919.1 uncharacterized protein LOC126788012 [Potentilla anserina]
MVQKLQAIKGGGGSIKVGATGTVSSLMTRELESTQSSKVEPPTSAASSRNKHQTAPVSIPCGVPTSKKLPRKSSDEASSSGTSTYINQRRPDIPQKPKTHMKTTSQIPMLDSHNIGVDKTPIRQKANKKGPHIVEVVDIKCGGSGRAWAGPVANRLKKLGFSKLSESVV